MTPHFGALPRAVLAGTCKLVAMVASVGGFLADYEALTRWAFGAY